MMVITCFRVQENVEDDVVQWCYEQFGDPGTERWDYNYLMIGTEFKLYNDCDITLFALRWGEYFY